MATIVDHLNDKCVEEGSCIPLLKGNEQALEEISCLPWVFSD